MDNTRKLTWGEWRENNGLDEAYDILRDPDKHCALYVSFAELFYRKSKRLLTKNKIMKPIIFQGNLKHTQYKVYKMMHDKSGQFWLMQRLRRRRTFLFFFSIRTKEWGAWHCVKKFKNYQKALIWIQKKIN